MPQLTFHLFGRFNVSGDGSSLSKLCRQKNSELLAYLFLNKRRVHAREELAETLWCDRGRDGSRKGLRQALWYIQTSLDEAGLADPLILADTDYVQLNPAAPIAVDLFQFESLFDQVRDVDGAQLTATHKAQLDQALRDYRGDLLAGWYQDWCLNDRERLKNNYFLILDKLMAYAEQHGQYEEGIVYGERLLKSDPARERTHRQLMRMRYLAGDRSGALRQFQRCVRFLQDELNVPPANATIALQEQIKVDDRAAVLANRESATLATNQAGTEQVLHSLLQFQHDLSQAQARIEGLIAAIRPVPPQIETARRQPRRQ